MGDAEFCRWWLATPYQPVRVIAAHAGCSQVACFRRARRLHLPGRTGRLGELYRAPIDEADFCARWEAGEPEQAMARRYGVHQSTVSYRARLMGLAPRGQRRMLRRERHSPSAGAQRRYACRVCGGRSLTPIHPACERAA